MNTRHYSHRQTVRNLRQAPPPLSALGELNWTISGLTEFEIEANPTDIIIIVKGYDLVNMSPLPTKG